jgi:hypothetical protein
MTDPIKPPVVTPIDAAEDALEHDEDSNLPEHERRDESTAGGGMLSQGGTAVDRGTGTGNARKIEDETEIEIDPESDPGEVVPTSHLPG